EDSKGRLWVGTASQGVDIFDYNTESFTHFKYGTGNASSMSANIVNHFAEDKHGNIFMAATNGLFVATEQATGNVGKPVFNFRNINSRVVEIVSTMDGKIWIAEMRGGLYTFTDYGTSKFRADTIPVNKYGVYPALGADKKNSINAFYEDSTQRKFYMLMNTGVTVYDENKKLFTITPFTREATFNNNSFCNLYNGSLWFAKDFLLCQYNVIENKLFKIESSVEAQENFLISINCMFTDRSGILWLGTKGYGILKYNPRAAYFHYADNYRESTNWMQEANNDKIMQITNGRYVWLFDKSTGLRTEVIPDSSVVKSAAYGNIGILQSAISTGENKYWIGKGYLMYYDAKTKQFTKYNKIAFPVFKANDGKIWFGSDGVFSSYNEVTKDFTNYKYNISDPGTPYNFLQAVYQDAKGFFWLGTTNGLLQFNAVTQQWKAFQNNPTDTASLSFNLIFSLCPDPFEPEKYLWIGTNGGGLNKFNILTGKVTRYSVKNGLANDVVYGILNDDEGNLWMSTNFGISKLNIKTNSFRNFEVNDGLQGNEFNRNSFCKTHDGILFFGGVNGFNYFDPKDLRDNEQIPNMVFTDFRIRNKSILFNQKNSPLDKPVYLTSNITLPYEDNMISFDFAALEFTVPEKNLYQYKLDGFDKDWIQSSTTHAATYTNLDPGSYTFHVKGSNSDGVWNETGTSIQLLILPPWYMTWWFRILVAVSIVASMYAFYRYRLQQALKLQTIRNKIASDLHDEIGSNLSSISIFSDVAKEQTEGQPVAPLLNKISNYTQQSMEAMSDIVWMINARNDRFENIIIRMRELAVELIEAKKYSLHLDIDEHLNTLKLGMNERKNFWLIYKEALNNIVKYAEAKNVWIKLSSSHKSILLTIKDDGNGFDATILKSGNGLHNMRQRSDAIKATLSISSSIGGGTTIELLIKI
ncbi:MAG: two-component regulator propeller domain-containing protein, partial [Panacibacter sp.]